MKAIPITNVAFTAAPEDLVETGLLGFVSCSVGDAIRLQGLTLRRTATGRLAVSFPARTDSAGRRHYFSHPLDDDARRDIEAQIFAALGLTTTS